MRLKSDAVPTIDAANEAESEAEKPTTSRARKQVGENEKSLSISLSELI